jgi:hypothetical protein
VSSIPPFLFDFQSVISKVNVIVDDDHILALRPVGLTNIANRTAGTVHEGQWFDRQNRYTSDSSLGDVGVDAATAGTQPMFLHQPVDGQEPDIMAGRGVSRPRITETDNQTQSVICHAGGNPGC